MNAREPYDVIIAGGGFVGAALAITLAKLALKGFRVALVDVQPKTSDPALKDARGLALSAASKSLLKAVDLWSALAPNAQAIRAIEITDGPLNANLRPHFLGFDEEMGTETPRAYLVEAGDLHRVMAGAVAETKAIDTISDSVADFESNTFSVSARLGGGATFEGRLLVAADGKRSRLRDGAGIKCIGWSYPQVGIVATVAHERPHDGRAVQHFLPAGPFAVLPLKGNRSSIVWTEDKTRGKALMQASEEEFTAELARRFGQRLGAIALEGPRQSFPLDFQIARSFVADRLVLVGDAAHVVHPLAGQGLNIGLRDVAALAETIVDAMRLGLDIGSSAILERYQRWRRFDSAFSTMVMDGLNRLFSNDNRPLRAIRDLGLGLVDRAPPLKRFLVSEAAGSTGAVPRLLKGEAL